MQQAGTDDSTWWFHITNQDLDTIEAALSLATTTNTCIALDEDHNWRSNVPTALNLSTPNTSQVIDIDVVQVFRALSAIENEESASTIVSSNNQMNTNSHFILPISRENSAIRRRVKAQRNLVRTVLLLMGRKMPDMTWSSRLEYLRNKLTEKSIDQSTFAQTIATEVLVHDRHPEISSLNRNSTIHAAHEFNISAAQQKHIPISQSNTVDLGSYIHTHHPHGVVFHHVNPHIHYTTLKSSTQPNHHTLNQNTNNTKPMQYMDSNLDARNLQHYSIPLNQEAGHNQTNLENIPDKPTRPTAGALNLNSSNYIQDPPLSKDTRAASNKNDQAFLGLGQTEFDMSSIPHVEFDLEDQPSESVQPDQVTQSSTLSTLQHSNLHDTRYTLSQGSYAPTFSSTHANKSTLQSNTVFQNHPSYTLKTTTDQLPMFKSFISWKSHIAKAKQDRNWVVRQWILATAFWRKNLLRSYTTHWHYVAVLSANATYFKNQTIQRTILVFWYKKALVQKRLYCERLLKSSFTALRQNVNSQHAAVHAFQKQHIIEPIFHFWRTGSRVKRQRNAQFLRLIRCTVDAKENRMKHISFKIWKGLYKRRHAARTLLAEYVRNRKLVLIKNAWDRWYHSIRRVQLLEIHRVKSLKFVQHQYLIKWKQRLLNVYKIQTIADVLVQRKNKLLIFEAFATWIKWRHISMAKSICHAKLAANCNKMLQTVIQFWHKRSRQQKGARKLVDSLEHTIQTNRLRCAWNGLDILLQRSLAFKQTQKLHFIHIVFNTFNDWRRKSALNKIVRRMRLVGAVKPTFKAWHYYVKSRKEQHSRAIGLRINHHQHVLRVYFKYWYLHTIKSKPLRTSVTMHLKTSQHQTILHYFCIWRNLMIKKYTLVKTDLRYIKTRETNITRHAFYTWKALAAHRYCLQKLMLEKTTTSSMKTLQCAFKTWRNVLATQNLQKKRARILVQRMWSQLRCRYDHVACKLPELLVLYELNMKTRICSALIHTWKQRTIFYASQRRSARRMSRYTLLRTSLESWVSCYRDNMASKKNAIQFSNTKRFISSFKQWHTKLLKARIKRVHMLFDNFQNKHRLNVLRSAYSDWHQNYSKRYTLVRRESAVARLFDRKIKTYVLRLWESKYIIIRKQGLMAQSQCNFYTQRLAFSQWLKIWRFKAWRNKIVRLSRQSHQNYLLCDIVKKWHSFASKERILKDKLAAQLNRVHLRKQRIVLSIWTCALKYRRLEKIKHRIVLKRQLRIEKIVFIHWRQVYMAHVAHCTFSEKACRSAFQVWRRRFFLKDGDRRALVLYYNKICGLALRKWIFKIRVGLGPVDLKSIFNDYIISLQILQISLPQPRFVRTSMVKNSDEHFALDSFLRVLYSNKVVVAMDGVPQNRPIKLTNIIKHLSDNSLRMSSQFGHSNISSNIPATSYTPLSQRYYAHGASFIQPQKSIATVVSNADGTVVAEPRVSISRSLVILARSFTQWHEMVKAFRTSSDYVERRYNVKLVAAAFQIWRSNSSTTRNHVQTMMQFTVYCQKKLIQRMFKLWRTRSMHIHADMYRATQYDQYKIHALGFHIWMYSTQRWQMISNASAKLHTHRVLATAYKKWVVRYRVIRTTVIERKHLEMADLWRYKQTCSHALKTMQVKFNRVQTLKQLADVHFQNRCTRKYTLKWMVAVIEHIRLRRLRMQAKYYYIRKRQASVFLTWYRQTQLRLNLYHASRYLTTRRQSQALQIWKKKTVQKRMLHDKLVKLKKCVVRFFVFKLGIVFHHWQKRLHWARLDEKLYKRERQFIAFQISKPKLLLDNIQSINQWVEQYYHSNTISNACITKKDIHTLADLSSAFKHWKNVTMRNKSDCFSTQRIVRGKLKAWASHLMIYKKHALAAIKKSNSRVLKRLFIHWNLKMKSRCLMNEAIKVETKIFTHWKITVQNSRLAKQHYLGRIFGNWMNCFQDKQDMKIRAVQHSHWKMLRHAVQTWQTRLKQSKKSNHALSIVMDRKTHDTSWRFRTMSDLFVKWKLLHQRRRFEMARKMIYAETWSEKRLKRKILAAWRLLCEAANAGLQPSAELSVIRHCLGQGNMVIGRLDPQIETLLTNTSAMATLPALNQRSQSNILLELDDAILAHRA
ncbi:hypothetical protein MT418_004304 [Batrachochytrium dendrobatidis]